jgi:hypothetical protein
MQGWSAGKLPDDSLSQASKKNLVLRGNHPVKPGQTLSYSATLQKLTAELEVKYYFSRQNAHQLAEKYHWPLQQQDPNGSTLSLQGLDESGKPHYYISYNSLAASNTRTNLLWIGNRLGYSLSGASTNLSGRLGVWDGGRVRHSHQEFTGRVVQQDDPSGFDVHATHVSGTLIASGLLPAARGMAFAAQLKAWDYNNDIPEIAAAASGLLVSNHSYGSLCGWRSTGRGWEWWGEPSLNETFDWKFGYYTNSAREWDIIAYQAPYYLLVRAAGNNRDSNGPPAGTSYFIANTNVTSTATRSRNDGYDIVTTNGNAKNILTVGAAHPIANGYNTPSDVVVASFSSWGPTDDGRIKPDLVGIGVNVLSTGSDNDQAYFASSGTSMSSPNVSGSLFLLQEYYAKQNRGNFMRSATLKGLALHTANEAGNYPGPDYVFGWGLLNAEKAASVIANRQGDHVLEERELTQNQTYTFQVIASGKGPLEATICWTDPEGSVSLLSPQSVNDRTPKLVNDLDLRISQGNQTFLPWTLDPDNPTHQAVPGDNIRDNVEKVYIPDAVPGKTYQISISHKGTIQRGPQAYALIVSGIGGRNYCTSQATSSTGARIDQFTLGSFQNSALGTCTTYSDFTHLAVPVTTGQTLAMSLTLGSCDTHTGKISKVFVDWNGDADFDDVGEWIATTPVIGGAETYQTTLTVPAGIKAGHTSRLRIVCAETGNPDQVQACGAYARGETQDYRISFQPPAKDVGIVDLSYPDQGFCAGSETGGVTVTVRNFGTAAQSNIPVAIEISTDNGTPVGTLNGTLSGTLHPGNETSLVIRGSFAAEAGKRYTFTCRTTHTGDADPANDGYTTTRNVSTGPGSPSATATICGDDPTVLRGTGNGTLFWYDAPTGGNLLAAGNPAYTIVKPPNHTYYAALNDFSGKTGPAGKTAFSGGSYGQHTGEMTFTTQAPLMLERARLYIGNGGKITFTVKNQQGNFVSATTLNVTATRNPAVAGEAGDDADDLGTEYFLNLQVPTAGTYSLAVSYEGGATLFRSNVGVAGYPFSIPEIMAITGSTSGNSTYLYLYDWRVKAVGCVGPRVPVVAQVSNAATATVNPIGPVQFCKGDSIVLRANIGAGLHYQWQKNGAAITSAIRDSLVVKESGLFAVIVTNASGCRSTSPEVEIRVDNITPVALRIVPESSPHLCSGQAVAVRLKAVTDLEPALFSYQWQRNGKDIPGADQVIYLAADTGSYTVSVSRPVCQVATSLPLQVSQESIRLEATSATVCGGSGSVDLFAQTSKGTIFWYDASTAGNLMATGNRFSTPTLSSERSFFVSVNEFSGTVASPDYQSAGGFSSNTQRKVYFHAHVPFVIEKATLHIGSAGMGQRTVKIDVTDQNFSPRVIASTVILVSPGVAEYALNLFVPDAGENYGLQVSEFGGGAEAYATTQPAAIHYPYQIPGVITIAGHNAPTPQGFYGYLYLWKIRAAGCASTSRQEVTVNVVSDSPPQATLSTNGIQSICAGQQATLSVDLTGTAPWSITYTNGQSPVVVSGIRRSPYLLQVSQAGTYTLQSVTDDHRCSNGLVSGTATVNVIPLPTDYPDIIASGPVSFCLGESVHLTASSGFDSYRWSTGETTRTILVQQSGQYTVAGSNNRCFGPSSPPIRVSALPLAEMPTILASGPLNFCAGDSVRLSAPAGYGLYSWNTGASTRSITVRNSGQYWVKAGNIGCISSASSPVTVSVFQDFPDKPEITTLGNRLSSSSPVHNQWLKEGNPIPGATNQTYIALSSGQYAVKVTQSYCATLSNEIAVMVTGLENTPVTETGVRLFPNPGNREFTVEYSSNQASSRVTAVLSNTLGIELRTMSLIRVEDRWEANFNTGNLAAGMYFVKITEGQQMTVRTWIKD